MTLPLSQHQRAGFWMAIIAMDVVIFDQLVKWIMLESVEIATRAPIVVTSWFKLVMVWNHGISFGMFATPERYAAYVLIFIALMICAVLVRLGLRSHHRGEWIAYALIIGGAIGNVIDRIRFGAVADFFYFHIGTLGWPAFNVADAAICIGVILLLWQSFFLSRRT